MENNRIQETARLLGISEAQVREVLQFEASQGTLTTTTRSIVTHSDGVRHWSSQACEQCS